MEILSDSKKQKILEQFSVGDDQIPRIKSNDASVIALGAKEGDMIQIYRKDPTGKYFYYRIVV